MKQTSGCCYPYRFFIKDTHGKVISGSKHISLHAQHELQLAADIINVHGGSGVAKSVYYYRTGEVLDRQLLHRLQSIAEKATLGTGSPAESLLEDLRSPLLLVACFFDLTSYIHPSTLLALTLTLNLNH